MAQREVDKVRAELDRVEVKIEEQEAREIDAIENNKPEEITNSYRERKERLVNQQKKLRDQLDALQMRLATSSGIRQREPTARPPVTLDEDAETAYKNAEPFVHDHGCLLSAAQWEIYQETRDAAAATRRTPTRTPVTTPATTRFSGLDVTGGGLGVVPTEGNALPAAAEARAVPAKDGVCPAWASGQACDRSCERNHCELHSPDFDHALAAGDRGRLARLLQEQAGGQWPLTLRQSPANTPILPFVGRHAVLQAIGKQVNYGFREITSGSHERDASILMTLTDGPGSGKTRLLSEVMQYCNSWGDHDLQGKLDLDEAVQKVVKDGLALCVAVDFVKAELWEADINLFGSDAALGLRIACASFPALPDLNELQRVLSGSEQELFTLPNVLPILATAVRRRAVEKAQPHAGVPESSKCPEQHLLLGILPDELQSVVSQMEDLGVARRAAVMKGRDMLSAIGKCVVAGVASDFKFVPFMLGAGTGVPQFDRFMPTEYNPTRLYMGPLTSDEIVGILSAALASKAWASLFDGTESERQSQCAGILRRRPIAVMLAELSGVARLVQYAHYELATERVKGIVARAERGFDTAVAVHVRERVLEQVMGLRQNAVELLGGVASTKEVLYLSTAGMPLPPRYQLFSSPGRSLADCLHSGSLFLDPANDTVVLRVPKFMLRELYRKVNAPSYEQLDWGIEQDKGEALERLCWELFFGAFGHPDVVSMRVELKQHVTTGRDKAGHLFVDKAGAVQFKDVRCLEHEVELDERTGHVNVWCDPGEGPGHKCCACIDHRLTLPQPSRSKPVMFLQQIKGEEGSALGQQILENWHMKARNTFKSLAEDFDLIYVYISARPLSDDGLKYIFSKRDLLVVPRQTLGAYLPVIYDRLVISGRALDALIVPA